jgi:predicted RNase H-like nuclease (RuvC/YqgF family)
MSYEALDKHEIECSYQSIQCPGCKAQMLKKDFSIHDNNCELFPLTCKDCKFTYIRNEADIKHTENICLRKQIERVQGELQEKKCEMQKLSHQVTEMRKLSKLNIKFDFKSE